MLTLNKILICIVIIVFNNFSSQNNIIAIPTIDNYSESFNYERLSQIKQLNKKTIKSEEYYTTQRENLLVVKNSIGEELINYTKSNDDKSGFSGYDYSENPIIGIFREFYPNNKIKTKGIFCWFGFKIGKWYNYDENGNLISQDDYDKGFKFTYKDIFEYCIKNNIPLDKKENGYKTSIRKHISTKDKIYLWGIDYLDTEKNLVKIIELNGKDGSISKTYEYPMPK